MLLGKLVWLERLLGTKHNSRPPDFFRWWIYQSRTSAKLELYLGHLSAKAALFGWVQASWGQHKVWQRQIKLLYQPREVEAAGIHVLEVFLVAFHPTLFIYLFILFMVSLQGADGGINIQIEVEDLQIRVKCICVAVLLQRCGLRQTS